MGLGELNMKERRIKHMKEKRWLGTQKYEIHFSGEGDPDF